MSYQRVMPRDLFNEANLLKCLGSLYLRTDGMDDVSMSEPEDDDGFDIRQDPSSGALYVANVTLVVRGEELRLTRPLNSRAAWPLYLELEEETISVFDSDGELTEQFTNFLQERIA